MHGVTAEVAQEIVVLFQDDDLDPGAGQQQRMNQARGTATGNTDLGLQDLSHVPTLPAINREPTPRGGRATPRSRARNRLRTKRTGTPKRIGDKPPRQDLAADRGSPT